MPTLLSRRSSTGRAIAQRTLAAMEEETIVLEGHIVDSLLLAKVLDAILDVGADYHIVDFRIGRTPNDPSRAVIEVTASDNKTLQDLLDSGLSDDFLVYRSLARAYESLKDENARKKYDALYIRKIDTALEEELQ